MIELTWGNLCKLFVWAKKAGADEPWVDDGDNSITIDGSIRKEDLDRFLSEQNQLAHEHHWVDISTFNLQNEKIERCTKCSNQRTVK